MKSPDDLKNMLKNYNIEPSPELREKVLSKALPMHKNHSRQHSGNIIWKMIMEKPVRTLLSTATAAAVIFILMVILPSSNSGIVLAEALANFNAAKIIKMNVFDYDDDGYGVREECWLDVDNQIIVVQSNTDRKVVMDLKNRTEKIINRDKQRTVGISDSQYERMKFDRDMVKWILKYRGYVPGIETDVKKWDIVSQDDKRLVVNLKLDNRDVVGEIILTIDVASKNLLLFEKNMQYVGREMQKIKMTFEYPESLPEIAVEEAKINNIIEEVNSQEEMAGNKLSTSNSSQFRITGKLIDESGNPVKGILNCMDSFFDRKMIETNESGEFVCVYSGRFDDSRRDQLVFAYNQDKSLGGVLWLQNKDNGKDFELVMKPTYDIVGKLEYEDESIKDKYEVRVMSSVVPLRSEAGGTRRQYNGISKIQIEPDGRFRIKNIPVGVNIMELHLSGDIIRNNFVELDEYDNSGFIDAGTLRVEYREGFGPDTIYDRIITGKVVDENGKLFWLAQVYVELPGKDYLYQTDYKGEFVTDALPSNAVINIRIMYSDGYGSQNTFAFRPLGTVFQDDEYKFVPYVRSEEYNCEVLIPEKHSLVDNYQIEITGKDQLLITLQPMGIDFIGKPMPEFDFEEWLVGQPISLADCKGKVVLIYYGLDTSWGNSSYFQKKIGEIVNAYNGYHQKGVEVIALHRYRASYMIKRDLIKAINVPFPIAIENKEGYSERIDPREYSGWYLIDKKGNCRAVMRSALYKQIVELLAE